MVVLGCKAKGYLKFQVAFFGGYKESIAEIMILSYKVAI